MRKSAATLFTGECPTIIKMRIRDLIHSTTIRIIAILLILALAVAVLYPRVRAYGHRKLADVVREVDESEARDLNVALARRAAEESVAFIAENMGTAGNYRDKYALFDATLKRVDPMLKGMYCEFGVYTGGTINYIASRVPGPVHGFDSFEGLPESWRAGFDAGTFKVEGLPWVRPNVKLYKGWFKDSLPVFKKDHPEPMAFGHLDADLYVSTKDVFDALGDHIVAGTVLQFDEFFNYPGWQDGESKAFLEFSRARQAEVEYIGYVGSSEQVAVRIKRIAPLSGSQRGAGQPIR
jgi:hypothetical protein